MKNPTGLPSFPPSVMSDMDFSRVHAAPGLGQPLEYVPAKDDPLYVRDPISNALEKERLYMCG